MDHKTVITLSCVKSDLYRERYSSDEKEIVRDEIEVRAHGDPGWDELFEKFRNFLVACGYGVPSGQWAADEDDEPPYEEVPDEPEPEEMETLPLGGGEDYTLPGNDTERIRKEYGLHKSSDPDEMMSPRQMGLTEDDDGPITL